MNHEGNGAPGFSVVYSEAVAQRIDDLAEQARTLGQLDAFLQAFRKIHKSLAENPLQFGEPKNFLKAVQILHCTAAVAPLHVRFGIREDLRIVFVFEINWLPSR